MSSLKKRKAKPLSRQSKKAKKEESQELSSFLNDEPEENTSNLYADKDDWHSLKISSNTLLSIKHLGFEKMLKIQSLCIPHLLANKNIIACAKTGSGKTLAFLVPCIEKIVSLKWDYQNNGVAALIISPTRELSMQIYQVAKQLCRLHLSVSLGLLIGGNPKPSDYKRIISGMCLCICTPGRLMDHMLNTKEFAVQNCVFLVMDEADRILEEGYANEMDVILSKLPKQKQTALFSATQTKKTQDLLRLSFAQKPIFIDANDCQKDFALSTRSDLCQGYVLVQMKRKFELLFSFIKRNAKKKIIVFFSTVAVTKFYANLLNYIDVKVYSLFGSMSQKKRSQTFDLFCDCQFGVLLATDVAARGLDIPNVDWIVQFDPPSDFKNYIHRVGRTCRGSDCASSVAVSDSKKNKNFAPKKKGVALLFLTPNETLFLNLFRKFKITVKQFELPASSKVANIQKQLFKITSSVYHLHVLAHQAYQAYVREYAMRNAKLFDVSNLDIIHVANCFALELPPKMTVENRKYKSFPLRLRTNQWINEQD